MESFRSPAPQPEQPFLAWRAATESYWHRFCAPADLGQEPQSQGKKKKKAVPELFPGCLWPEPAGGSSKMFLLKAQPPVQALTPRSIHRPQTEPVTKAQQGHNSMWPDSLRKSSKVTSVTRGTANLTSHQQSRAQPCFSKQDLPTPTMNCAWTEQYQINKCCIAHWTLVTLSLVTYSFSNSPSLSHPLNRLTLVFSSEMPAQEYTSCLQPPKDFNPEMSLPKQE